MPASTPRSSSRAWTARASGTRTTSSLRYGAAWIRGAPAAARAASSAVALRRPERRDVAQPVGPDRRQVDGRGEREQRLVRADVRGGLLAPDVLLPRAERHDERPSPVEVGRDAHQAARDLADERIRAGDDAEVRAAEVERDAQRLALAGGDVRAVLAGRGEDRERHGLDDRHEQRTGRVGEAADGRHVLEQPEDVRLGDDHAGDRVLGVGEQPLQRLEVGGAGERPVTDERDLVGLEAGPVGVGRERLAVVRVDAARDEQPLAARRAAGHERRLGGRGAAVVVRRGHDVHRGELGQQRLVLVDALQRALADLGLVGRVGRVPLAAEQHLVDGRRAPVAVRTRAEERGEVHAVAPGQRLEPRGEVELGLRVVEAERARAERLGDVVEQGVHGGDPDRLQHPGPVVGYVRPVRHVSPRRSAARRPTASRRASTCAGSASLTRSIQPAP